MTLSVPMSCDWVCEQIANGSTDEGGSLRTHVERCVECRVFAEGVLRQRADMAAVLPVTPSLAVKERVGEKTWNRDTYTGMEVRGIVGMNGYGQLCFFPHSRAEGVPLFDEWGTVAAARLREAVETAPVRRFTHTEVAALDPPDAD